MKPKYHIGQEVFYLESREILKKKVTGIVILFKESRWQFMSMKGKEPTFDHYEYNFEIGDRPSDSKYTWIPEDRLFLTKEELLASL